MSARILGNTAGLKKSQFHLLERTLRRKVPRDELASADLLRHLSESSKKLQRRLAVIVDRKGTVSCIIVGDPKSLRVTPFLPAYSVAGRLAGVRLIQTRFDADGLSKQDESVLRTHRLDLLANVYVDKAGHPGNVTVGHIVPSGNEGSSITVLEPVPYARLDLPFEQFIEGLDEELRRKTPMVKAIHGTNRAILCALNFGERHFDEALAETRELAGTAGLVVADTLIQRRETPDPKFGFGHGKVDELNQLAHDRSADLLLFHQNLSPNQARHLAEATRLKVLDRTQLILDIFAKHAKSHDGKLQVELAQLRYTLPHLRERDTQMSRLVGGIGGMGPGETKLEIRRRRAQERIKRLERDIESIAEKRAAKRSLRIRNRVPTISIVGYTNAGKSTLLNTLTHASAHVEAKMFATLDPYSKRLRFPRDREVILTDTVGFIRELPKDLIAAFRATLEEIGEAALLLHVVDVASEGYEDRIRIVNQLLTDLGFGDIPQLVVLNKIDRLSGPGINGMARGLNGVPVSALNPESCRPLLRRMEDLLWHVNRHTPSLNSPTELT